MVGCFFKDDMWLSHRGDVWNVLEDRGEYVEFIITYDTNSYLKGERLVLKKDEIYSYFEKRVIEPKYLEKNDQVNHPSHYNKGIEVIDFIESHDMDFNTGNVIKYVARAKHKGKYLEDLKKAQWYLNRLIELEERK